MTVLCIAGKWGPVAKPAQMAFIERFARGCNGHIVDVKTAYKSPPEHEWCIRGAKFRKEVQEAWRQGRRFYYIDNGYFGNTGRKIWFRIIRDNVHDTRDIIPRPRDRLDRCDIVLRARQKGTRVLLAPPSEKSFLMWNMDQQQWIDETLYQLRAVTDRPIDVRYKQKRDIRMKNSPIEHSLDDVHCVVTYNSVIAVESIMLGVPAITLRPNAAAVVSSRNINDIEDPVFPDDDLREQWLRHLSYSQFTFDEMSDGTAFRILNEL